MKKRIILLVLLVIVALLGAYFILRREQPQEGPLKVYGNVDIRDVTLAFRVSGRVAVMHFDEGERVEAGDLLAELDADPYEEKRRQAEAELAVREAQLDLVRAGYRPEELRQARARVAEAEASLQHAEIVLVRQRNLREEEAATQADLDAAVATRDRTAAALEAVRSQLELLEAGFREEEIRQAESGVQLARAKLDEAVTQTTDTRLLAPAAGTVLTRVTERGSIVAPGSPVMVISLQEDPWIRAYVPETQLGRVVPGMRVEVHTDTRPGRPYSGRVGFISPTAEFTPKSVHTESLRTNLVYRFRVILDEADEALRQGMPVTVILHAEEETP